MITRTLFALALATALTLGGPAGLGVVPAAALGCLSAAEVRVAVQSGRVIPLSSVLASIRATVSGQILPPPALCDVGGRLVYMVNVLSAGQVKRLQVDAENGEISY